MLTCFWIGNQAGLEMWKHDDTVTGINFGTLQSRFWYFDRSISGEVLNNGFSLFLFVLNLWWFALEILLGILLLHKRPQDGRSQKTRSDEGLRFCGGNFPWLTMCLGLSHTDIPSRELTYPLLKALLKIIFLFRLWDVLVIHRQVCACSTFIQNGERFAELGGLFRSGISETLRWDSFFCQDWGDVYVIEFIFVRGTIFLLMVDLFNWEWTHVILRMAFDNWGKISFYCEGI